MTFVWEQIRNKQNEAEQNSKGENKGDASRKIGIERRGFFFRIYGALNWIEDIPRTNTELNTDLTRT